MKRIGELVAQITTAPPVGKRSRRGDSRKLCLEFRQSPLYPSCRGLLAALSHELAKINAHWDYADKIICLMSNDRVQQIEHAAPRQLIAVLRAVKSVK